MQVTLGVDGAEFRAELADSDGYAHQQKVEVPNGVDVARVMIDQCPTGPLDAEQDQDQKKHGRHRMACTVGRGAVRVADSAREWTRQTCAKDMGSSLGG